ncbi:acyl--CoA ligase [Amycolatopsis sp. K13G38]|uniref:Acyl--CoA ligase n=1 Tax=Amycolatopsis acididurans TaxID=2724524 RepID=A0ABX1JA24_9PSEU|nr:class I adenylate-forming enzyme family protein [Amycolatopsis acididurans]NKQ56141.1 acyl--CoA ligase [Amycolatopsis acididurans]
MADTTAGPRTYARTVGEILDRAADRRPEGLALLIGDRRLTYHELRREAEDLAAGLLAAGVRPGDRVCLFAPNIAESYVALFATAKAGAVFVPVNPRLTERELRQVLIASEATTLLFVPQWQGIDYIERLRGLFPGLGGHDQAGSAGNVRLLVALRGQNPGARTYSELVGLGRSPAHRAALSAAAAGTSPEDAVFLQFTSGTTSTPKAALLAHGATTRMSHELGARFALTVEDRYFGCPPICHLGGTTFSFLSVMSRAATFVTLPVFAADDALSTMERERCTVLHGIDSHLRLLMASPGFDPVRLPLRLVSVSAVAQTVQEVAGAFGAAVVISQYGSTETGGAPICAAAQDPASARLGTVGRPLPGITAVAVSPESGRLLGAGEVGEIRIGGWSLMMGYLGQPEATAALIDDDGRLRTGDLGYVDEAGFLHFTGRLKNMLRTGGENVSVEEVESVLSAYPGVTMAVVVGVPDGRLGEVGFAYLLCDRSVDAERVREYCLTQLAKFKVPRHFEIRGPGRLPMTASGKVQRKDLQKSARAAIGLATEDVHA